MEIKLYRHICRKDLYLARNWSYCGGGINTPFYYATKDVMQAIQDANKPDFLSWHMSISFLTAKITDTKEVAIDGYTGKISKELSFPVSEFECVTLREVDNG